MSEAQKIQKEIDALNSKMAAVKSQNSVNSFTGKTASRGFTYRKQTIVTGLEAVVSL